VCKESDQGEVKQSLHILKHDSKRKLQYEINKSNMRPLLKKNMSDTVLQALAFVYINKLLFAEAQDSESGL
jgi:hypothetical protein